MAFLSGLNISASGLTAQRMRLDVAAENLANMNTTRTEEGGPYLRKMVVFQPITSSSFSDAFNNARQGAGVVVSEIIEDDSAFKTLYDPTHPDANEEGYVDMPNISNLQETTDAMAATRAYEANVTAFNALKAMASKGLEVGQ